MDISELKNHLGEWSLLEPLALAALILPSKGVIYVARPLGDSIALLLAYLWIAALVVGWSLLIRAVHPRTFFGQFDVRVLSNGVLWGVGLFVAGEGGRTVSHLIGLEQQLQIDPQGAIGVLLALAVPIVMAPVVEEFAFRGLVFEKLRSELSETAAITLSAVLFSIYHVDLYQLLPTFLLGIGLALLVIRTNGLWAAILAHSIFNISSLLVAILGVTPLA